MIDISVLEKRIGIDFGDKNLLITALVRKSYANENKNFDHNERLEFLGDAVLSLIMAEFFYNNSPGHEGELTVERGSLVNKEKLPIIATEMNLEEHLLIGKGEKMDVKAREKYLGDSLEALIGAIFLEKGYEIAKQFVTDNFSSHMDLVLIENLNNNPKGKFQEEALKRGPENPSYKVLDEWGPDKNNDKHFRIGLFLKDEKVAEGEGTNTKEAEKKVAEKGLDLLSWS